MTPRAMRPGSAAVTLAARKTRLLWPICTENPLCTRRIWTRLPDSVTAAMRPRWIVSRPDLRGKTAMRRNVPALNALAP